jgi:hypothetical protein
MGALVHSEPISSLHGGRHSRIVSPRGVSSTSTRMSSRNSGGDLVVRPPAVRSGRIGGDEVAGGRSGVCDTRAGRSQPVVEVAAQSSALVLDCSDRGRSRWRPRSCPCRSPTSISPIVSSPSRSGTRVTSVTRVPELASSAPSTVMFAYGSTSASRTARTYELVFLFGLGVVYAIAFRLVSNTLVLWPLLTPLGAFYNNVEAGDIDLPWASNAGFAEVGVVMLVAVWFSARHRRRLLARTSVSSSAEAVARDSTIAES